MSDNSKIEWTESTWNPVRGCTKVSPGCAHCYAETFAERFRGVKGHPYEQGFDLRLVPEKLNEPLSWRKPRRVFVNSMSDLFQDGVPDEYIDRVFAVMALTPQHTYQVLTKRAERMRAYLQGNAPWRWTRHMPNIGVKALDRWDREYHAHALERVARRQRRKPALRRRADPAAAADAGGRAVHQRGTAARACEPTRQQSVMWRKSVLR
jgi:hypothetical protein